MHLDFPGGAPASRSVQCSDCLGLLVNRSGPKPLPFAGRVGGVLCHSLRSTCYLLKSFCDLCIFEVLWVVYFAAPSGALATWSAPCLDPHPETSIVLRPLHLSGWGGGVLCRSEWSTLYLACPTLRYLGVSPAFTTHLWNGQVPGTSSSTSRFSADVTTSRLRECNWLV